jgi:hypothetical protein
MTRVITSKSLRITYGPQFRKMSDHFEDRVPPSLNIVEELQLGNFNGFFGILGRPE